MPNKSQQQHEKEEKQENEDDNIEIDKINPKSPPYYNSVYSSDEDSNSNSNNNNNSNSNKSNSPILKNNKSNSPILKNNKTNSSPLSIVNDEIFNFDDNNSSNNESIIDLKRNKSLSDLEISTRIRKKFEDSLEYFSSLLDIITNTKSKKSTMLPSNQNYIKRNSAVSTPTNIFINNIQRSKVGSSHDNLLNASFTNGTSNSQSDSEGRIEGDFQIPIGGTINNSDVDNSSDSLAQQQPKERKQEEPQVQFNNSQDADDENSFYDTSTTEEDEDLYHDNGKLKTISQMKSELEEFFLHLSFKKREEISFSLSVEQDPLVIDQTISQYFEMFVNECYNEIINKFQFQFPNIIDTIKIMRSSPEIKIAGNPNENYIPLHKSSPSYKKFSIVDFTKKKLLSGINSSNVGSFFLSMIPIVDWIPKYQLKYIKDDVISSLTVGFMIVPQAMAYAILAGLQPIYGLYAAFISPIVYGIFGTSNEISVGPVAMVSLLIPNVVSVPSTDPEYVVEVLCLSLLSGLILIVIGFLRAGFIIENLLSNPILMGFIQAASLLIICSQIKNLTQIPIPSTVSSLPEFIQAIAEHYKSIHGWTVLFGLCALVVLVSFRFINNRIKYKVPIAVIILFLSTLISYLINSKSHGIKIIDTIPSGLPVPRGITLNIDKVGKLIVGAFIISILGFVESISIAKKFSSIRKYSIEPSQELIALGMCNFVGSFFQACPSTGSFSRTAVNFQTNSRSRVCSIASGVIVACVLLFLTPIIKHTPLCILSAIVIAAAITLFEFKESYELLKGGEILGFIQLVFVFLITLMFGSEVGIVVAFCVSILQIIYFSARPQLVSLGRLPGTLVFRNIKHYSGAIVNKRVKILRYDSRLTYYTVNHFRDTLYKMNSEEGFEAVHTIIFDMVNVSSIDSTAIDVLNEIIDYYKAINIQILWSDIRPFVQQVMHRSGFLKRLDHHHFFTSTHKAVEYALSS
ncbi:hypothetical protein DICPUDRAFT_74876 [Dictyostelium purpureum]|uniref:STAS domain-containing protein n=1 Tax=Dictyostelium purpureum TaxID=5786 RepID=F0Z900_DICPU|nr:uncharacterized protein DICPUDRAFT_74876 [Dictyostelium purpureum]EGC39550.1 hypothetical protein DICPUDRAFT_74876 [Dictyostelium purpureum]|eukprot:XP_003283885.1 hypothetical protein DICPUDRAFT_74876 [Dictyostelium purpureum]